MTAPGPCVGFPRYTTLTHTCSQTLDTSAHCQSHRVSHTHFNSDQNNIKTRFLKPDNVTKALLKAPQTSHMKISLLVIRTN